jgi:hypothetical protein
MTKARTLANFISDNNEFADGTISVSEVSGAAPLASPSFTGNLTVDTDTLYVDSSSDEVGIGVNPSHVFHAEGNVSGDWISLIKNTHTSNGYGLKVQAGDNNDVEAFRVANLANDSMFSVSSGGLVVVNDSASTLADFRVESVSNTHALFVDSSANRLGVLTSAPDAELHISSSHPHIDLGPVGGNRAKLGFRYDNLYLGATSGGGEVILKNNIGSTDAPDESGDEIARFGDNVIINESGRDQDFRVESNNNANALFVDAGVDKVAIGHNAPVGHLDIYRAYSSSDDPKAIVIRDNTSTSNVNLGGIYWSHTGDRSRAAIKALNSGAYGRKDISFWTSAASDWTSTDADMTKRFNISYTGNVSVVNDVAAPTNSVSNPGTFKIRGNGWDTARGSRSQGWGFQSRGTYSNPVSGQVYPVLNFQATTSDDVFVDTTVAGFVYESPYYKFYTNGGAVINEGSYDQDFRVESNSNANMLKVDAGNDCVGIGTGSPSSSYGLTVRNAKRAALFFKDSSNDGDIMQEITWDTSGFATRFYVAASGAGANGAATAMYIGRNNSTNRSINASGTINASGSDYAEYMVKADTAGTINKGDVCGIDVNGKLTTVWADAISFVVKSTDPSYVGGDTWFNDEERPNKDEVTAEEYAAFEERLETARATVDRIAFSGQVPVNVTGATVGDYIVPLQDGTGITGQAVSNPTFDQYMAAVGKVIAIEDDGRAKIIVKIA